MRIYAVLCVNIGSMLITLWVLLLSSFCGGQASLELTADSLVSLKI